MGFCYCEPTLKIVNPKSKDIYIMGDVTLEKAKTILDKIIKNEKTEGDVAPRTKEKRVSLLNCGDINPESFENAVARGAYFSLENIITNFSKESIVDSVEKSGLRGRGGAGYLTGKKWRALYENKSSEKYVICNADEGDPGAFMDRSILAGDPHLVLEGMIIGGFAVGAKNGIIYIRAEYPQAIEILLKAIEDLKTHGILGNNIKYLGSYDENKTRGFSSSFIMPCLAKKYEASRNEFIKDGNRDTDISISTRELADMIKYFNIEFKEIEEVDFDNPMGKYTGAGIIFGRTGGVLEAALRTAHSWMIGEELDDVNILKLEKSKGLTIKKINFGSKELKIGVAHGLGNARKLLEDIQSGREQYHVIEIMACHCGCVGGGGQPFIHEKVEILEKRVEALNKIDVNSKLRKSHENPYVKKLYEDYFDFPCSEKAKALLHTKFYKK